MSPENFIILKKTLRRITKLTLETHALQTSDPCNKKQEAKLELIFKDLLKAGNDE